MTVSTKIPLVVLSIPALILLATILFPNLRGIGIHLKLGEQLKAVSVGWLLCYASIALFDIIPIQALAQDEYVNAASLFLTGSLFPVAALLVSSKHDLVSPVHPKEQCEECGVSQELFGAKLQRSSDSSFCIELFSDEELDEIFPPSTKEPFGCPPAHKEVPDSIYEDPQGEYIDFPAEVLPSIRAARRKIELHNSEFSKFRAYLENGGELPGCNYSYWIDD